MSQRSKNFKIDNAYIASLDPCKMRHDNYLAHYKDTSFSVVEFLKLDNITYNDKLWVWKRFTTKEEAIRFGVACADSVLDIFESKHPEDKRPRNALNAVVAYIKDPTKENRQRCKDAVNAANAAANAVNAADAAAYAAAAYAADAADAAADAANAAANAAYAANAARRAAREEVRIQQQDLNLLFLVDIYSEMGE
jgi:hypothetical protein